MPHPTCKDFRFGRITLRSLSFLFVFLISASSAIAQTGSISGKVSDLQTGEDLIGANVSIVGTLQGAATDFNGLYTIADVEPGTYSIKVSFIGFFPMVVEDIEVVSGAITELNIDLKEERFELDEEVVVEGRMVRDNSMALLNERKKAAAMSDAIGSEEMSRSGSSNATDALAKVTGASVVDGKYVYVRGLGDRYVSAQLNGAVLPSADPDRNAAPLDLLPSSLIENIVTTKTYTPDQPGNFTGGAVNVGTKNFPDGLSISVSSSASLNTAAGINGNLLSPNEDPSNFLGQSNYSFPSLFEDPNYLIPDVGVSFTNEEAATQLDAASRSFNSSFAAGSIPVPVNSKFSISLGNQIEFLGKPLGILATASYGSSSKGYNDGTSARYQATGNLAGLETLTENFRFNDQKGTTETSAGGLVNLSYRIFQGHELTANYMYNQSGESFARLQSGSFPRDLSEQSVYETRTLGFTDRNLQSFQLKGDHDFQLGLPVNVKWMSSRANSTQYEPDLRFFTSHSTPNSSGEMVHFIRPSLYPVPTRYFRDLSEDNFANTMDVTFDFMQWSGLEAKLKTGASFTKIDRSFRESRYQYEQDRANFTGDIDAFFAGDNLGLNIEESTDRFFRFGNYIIDATELSSNYDGDQNINAGYLMVDMPLLSSLRFVGGARLETTGINVVSQDERKEVGDLSETDILPSASLTYLIDEKTNFRVAYGRTLARPTFRELAPYSTFSFVGDYVLVGNPDLERTLINSYDLRLERFMGLGEVVSLSGFYKDFNNPIERVINPIAGNLEVQYRNVAEATVYGVELEARKSMGVLSSALNNVSIGGNVTFANSQVRLADDELEAKRVVDPNHDGFRPLQGQSPFVINLDAGYNNLLTGTSFNVYYNVFGSRLAEVSRGGTPDLYEQARHMIDMTFSQSLISGFTIKASIKNLLDSKYSETQEFKGISYEKQVYSIGRSFSLGVSYGL